MTVGLFLLGWCSRLRPLGVTTDHVTCSRGTERWRFSECIEINEWIWAATGFHPCFSQNYSFLNFMKFKSEDCNALEIFIQTLSSSYSLIKCTQIHTPYLKDQGVTYKSDVIPLNLKYIDLQDGRKRGPGHGPPLKRLGGRACFRPPILRLGQLIFV